MGRRIRQRRRETGISQTELAGHLGLTFQQVQKYEKGINRVGAAQLQQIAKMLGVDIPFFYDGDGKEPDVDSLLVVNSVFSLRLLRAYTAIKDKAVRRQLVILVEMIAVFVAGSSAQRRHATSRSEVVGSAALRANRRDCSSLLSSSLGLKAVSLALRHRAWILAESDPSQVQNRPLLVSPAFCRTFS